MNDPETLVFSTSLNNALAYAIARVGAPRLSKLKLTTVRHQIIKLLIAAESEVDVAPQFQYTYISPLQIACGSWLWPVIVDLIEAGSQVHVDDPDIGIPLVTAATIADRSGEDHLDGTFEDDDWSQAGPSRKKGSGFTGREIPDPQVDVCWGIFIETGDRCMFCQSSVYAYEGWQTDVWYWWSRWSSETWTWMSYSIQEQEIMLSSILVSFPMVSDVAHQSFQCNISMNIFITRSLMLLGRYVTYDDSLPYSAYF